MCTEDQHSETLRALGHIEKQNSILIAGRSPTDATYNISNTKGFVLDYKNRKHIYLWTAASGLSLNLNALGTLSISQYEWTLIDFKSGLEIFATSATTTDTAVYVRCTDEVLSPNAITQGAGAGIGTAWRVEGDYSEQANLSANALNADLLPSTDVSAYRWFSVQVTAIAAGGQLTFQGSNDGIAFYAIPVYSIATGAANSVSAVCMVWGAISYHYLRVRQTAWTSGTSTGVAEFYTQAPAFMPTTTNIYGTGGNIGITRVNATVLNQASAAQTANGNSADLTVSSYDQIAVDINVTANSGTSQTLQLFWDRKGADGVYYPIWQSAVQTTTNNQISTSIGEGMAYNQCLGATGRLRWVIGGTTPSYTFSASVIGK